MDKQRSLRIPNKHGKVGISPAFCEEHPGPSSRDGSPRWCRIIPRISSQPLDNWELGRASPWWIHCRFHEGTSLTPVLNNLLKAGGEAGNESKGPLHLKRWWGRENQDFPWKGCTAAAWRGLPLAVFHGQQEWWRRCPSLEIVEWENSKFLVLGGGREHGPGHLQICPKILGKHGYKTREKIVFGNWNFPSPTWNKD